MQFFPILVPDSKKTASKQFRFDAEVDASAITKEVLFVQAVRRPMRVADWGTYHSALSPEASPLSVKMNR